MSRKLQLSTIAVGGALALVSASGFARAESENDHPPTAIIAFGTMYGVDEGFVGDANPIRDVAGDELPWVVEGSARGRLDVTGHLRIRVRGLVFTNDEEVPPELRGTNDEDQFRARVSCLSEDEDTGAIITADATTEGFPATPSGDSDIDAHLTLPNPCVAPIVFILAGSEEKWFAVTGFESESAGEPGGNHGNGDDLGENESHAGAAHGR